MTGDAMGGYFDPVKGAFGCPACDRTFICDDGSEWEDYATHLRGHLVELVDDDE